MRGISSSVLCGTVAAFLFLTAVATADQSSKLPLTVNIFHFSTVEILDSDSELNKLLKQRYNAAGEDLAARSHLYAGGRVKLEDVLASLERFTKAGLELDPSPDKQLGHLATVVAVAQKVEAVVREKFSHEVEPVQALKHANVARLDLEIQLYRARELAKAKAAK